MKSVVGAASRTGNQKQYDASKRPKGLQRFGDEGERKSNQKSREKYCSRVCDERRMERWRTREGSREWEGGRRRATMARDELRKCKSWAATTTAGFPKLAPRFPAFLFRVLFGMLGTRVGRVPGLKLLVLSLVWGCLF